MKLIKLLLLNMFLITTITATITGCDRLSGDAVAVIDLTAISKATGEDEVVKNKMEQATAELNAQLSEAIGILEKELAEKKGKLGKSPSQEQVQDLQQFAQNASQQLKQNQAVAQQKAQQYKMGLLMSWREQMQPVVDGVARKRNAKVVLVSSPALMWFDESVDITAEVIASLRAHPAKELQANTDAPIDAPSAVSGDPAENAESNAEVK